MPERLTHRLVQKGLITRSAANEAIDRLVLMGGALDTCLLELQLIDEETLCYHLAETYGLEAATRSMLADETDPETAAAFPVEWAKKHVLAPLECSTRSLRVLSPAPADLEALQHLGERFERPIHPVLAPEFRVRERLQILYGARPGERFQALLERYGRVSDPVGKKANPARSVSPPSTASVETVEPVFSFADAVTSINAASSPDEIAHIAVRYAAQWLPFVALLRVDQAVLRGWVAQGPLAERLTSVAFELQEESAFSVVCRTHAHHLGPLPSDPVQNQLIAQLQHSPPRSVLILPVRTHGHVSALLYGDNEEGMLSQRLATDLTLFINHVQVGLELASDPFAPARAVGPESSLQPESPIVPRPHSHTRDAAALPTLDDGRFDAAEFRAAVVADSADESDLFGVLGEPSEEPTRRILRGPPSERRPVENDDRLERSPETGVEAGWASVDAESWDEWAPVSAPLVGPNSTIVDEPGMSAGTSEPDPIAETLRGSLREDATVPDLSTEAWIRASSEVTKPKPLPPEVVQRSELPDPDSGFHRPVPLTHQVPMTRRSYPARALPAPLPVLAEEDDDQHLDLEALIDAAPSIETSAPNETGYVPVVEALVSTEPHQRALAAETLLKHGTAALPAIMARFPGVLEVDPFVPGVQLPAFAKCGVLLALLERMGAESHRLVADQLDDRDPLRRFFAIYFYAAVYVPAAIPKLIQRLNDEESRICMLAARTLFSYRDHRDYQLVLDHLHGRLSAAPVGAQRHAAYLIGLFRDVSAVPQLIAILERKDRNLQDVVLDALAEITKNRLGSSARKWRTWWSKNQHRSRIEWLLDGLGARDEDLRISASEELSAVTGIDLGFDGAAPRRRREEARQRWLKWWKAQQSRRAASLA